MLYGILLTSSILLQAAAVTQTLRLLHLTGWRTPWLLLVLAISFILISRLSGLYLYLNGHEFHNPELFAEILAVIASLFLLVALERLHPLISSAETIRKILNKNRRQLHQAQQMGKLGFWEWNLISNEFNCSEEMADMLSCELDKSDRNFQGLLNHVHEDDRINFQEKMNRSLYEQEVFDIKHRLIAKDNIILNFWHQAEVVFDKSGRPRHVYGFLQDITEQTRAEQRLAETNSNLQQQQTELAHASRMAMLGEMASGIAHEINQPLGAILIYANGGKNRLAESSLSATEISDVFEQIVTQADRAAEIVKRMRAFVRKEEVDIQEIDLETLIKQAITFVYATTRSRPLEFETDFEAGLPHVYADTIQIEQVITNLILNAHEAMEQANTHYRMIRINVYSRAENFVEVTVSDTGPGIDRDNQQQLFDPFFTSKTNGLGLGLSICRTIIENSGGVLELVTDFSNPGACFKFSLPTQRVT